MTLGVCWLLKVTHPGGKCISAGAPSMVLTHMKSRGAVRSVRQAITCAVRTPVIHSTLDDLMAVSFSNAKCL